MDVCGQCMSKRVGMQHLPPHTRARLLAYLRKAKARHGSHGMIIGVVNSEATFRKLYANNAADLVCTCVFAIALLLQVSCVFSP